jgi:hypothetical protein
VATSDFMMNYKGSHCACWLRKVAWGHDVRPDVVVDDA